MAWSLVTTVSDATTVYGNVFKYLVDHKFTPGINSISNSQMTGKITSNIKYFQNQRCNVSWWPIGPWFPPLFVSPCVSKGFLYLNVILVIMFTLDLIGIYVDDSSQKKLEHRVGSRLVVQWFIFTKVRSDKKGVLLVYLGRICLTPTFLPWQISKAFARPFNLQYIWRFSI